jgi:hypothetical protein
VKSGAGFTVAEPVAVWTDQPFVEAWVCEQPPRGVKYRVLRDEWLQDYTIRLIHEIEIVTPEGNE